MPSNEGLRTRITLIREEAEKLRRDKQAIYQENEELKAQVVALTEGIARLEQNNSKKSPGP